MRYIAKLRTKNQKSTIKTMRRQVNGRSSWKVRESAAARRAGAATSLVPYGGADTKVVRPCAARSTTVADLIEFDAMCLRAAGRSKKTVTMTTTALRRLESYLHGSGQPTDVNRIGPQEMRVFILHLQTCARFESHPFAPPHEEFLKPVTVNAYLRAIRAAWNRWVGEGVVDSSPFEVVKVPSAPRRVIPTFSSEQLRALFAAIDTSTPAGFRDYTFFSILLDTAARLGEISNLRMGDVDLERRQLRIMGKGQRERMLPIGSVALKALWKYSRRYRPEPAGPRFDHVFLTLDGRPLTNSRVETIMHRYARKAGIRGVRCSPHTLRHTACICWLRNGGDVFSLQQLTGHSSIEVLQGYVHLADDDVVRAHRSASPLDNLGLGDIAGRKAVWSRGGHKGGGE